MRQKFVDGVICWGTGNPWAAHSPDLNPCDVFLRGYTKDYVYDGNPTTLQDLKTTVAGFIRATPSDMCEIEFVFRLNECLNFSWCTYWTHLMNAKKLLQTENKVELNTRNKIPWDMPQDNKRQIAVSKRVYILNEFIFA